MNYSGSATKLLFALLYSPSTQLESFLHNVNKLPLGEENLRNWDSPLTFISVDWDPARVQVPLINGSSLTMVSTLMRAKRLIEMHIRDALCELEEFYRVSFKDHVLDLDINDTVNFKLGGVRKHMTMRQFSLAMGLYTTREIKGNFFAAYHDSYTRNKPRNYDPTEYFQSISTKLHFDSTIPCSYTSIKTHIRRLVYRLLTLSVSGRSSAKEKVILADFFYLQSMDGGKLLDVPWHVAKFMSDKAKVFQKKSKIVGAHLIGRLARHFGLISDMALSVVTRGNDTTLYDVVKLCNIRIVRFNGLGQAKMVDPILNDSDEEAEAVEDKRAQDENKGEDVKELTRVVSGMSEQFDDHTRYDGTPYTYVHDIPDLEVQQGVNYMSSPQTFPGSSAPPPPHPFGLFPNPDNMPSTSCQYRNDMNEE
ncbi:hypothetical protein Tco_1466479 [Tanacetum coccineum]